MKLAFISEEPHRDTMLNKMMSWLGLRGHVSSASFWGSWLPQYLSTNQVKRALTLTRIWGEESMALQAEYLKGTREEQYDNRELIEDALESLESAFYHSLFELTLVVDVDLTEGRTTTHPLLTPEQQYEYAGLARHWLTYRLRGAFQRAVYGGDCSLVISRAYAMLELYLVNIPAPEHIEAESLL